MVKEVDVVVHGVVHGVVRGAEGGREASGDENYDLILILPSLFLYLTFDKDVGKN